PRRLLVGLYSVSSTSGSFWSPCCPGSLWFCWIPRSSTSLSHGWVRFSRLTTRLFSGSSQGIAQADRRAEQRRRRHDCCGPDARSLGPVAAVLAFGDAYRIPFVAAGVAFLLATLLPGGMTAFPNGAPLAHKMPRRRRRYQRCQPRRRIRQFREPLYNY